jgi:hypothetical protein
LNVLSLALITGRVKHAKKGNPCGFPSTF